MRIVVAVDGSPASARAVAHAAELAASFSQPPKLVLLAVDPTLMPGIERRIGADAVSRIHAENTEHAFGLGREILGKANLAFEERSIIGDPASEIVRACAEPDYDLLVMGSRGRGAVQSAFLGSVALKVLSGSTVPVTIVR